MLSLNSKQLDGAVAICPSAQVHSIETLQLMQAKTRLPSHPVPSLLLAFPSPLSPPWPCPNMATWPRLRVGWWEGWPSVPWDSGRKPNARWALTACDWPSVLPALFIASAVRAVGGLRTKTSLSGELGGRAATLDTSVIYFDGSLDIMSRCIDNVLWIKMSKDANFQSPRVKQHTWRPTD